MDLLKLLNLLNNKIDHYRKMYPVGYFRMFCGVLCDLYCKRIIFRDVIAKD